MKFFFPLEDRRNRERERRKEMGKGKARLFPNNSRTDTLHIGKPKLSENSLKLARLPFPDSSKETKQKDANFSPSTSLQLNSTKSQAFTTLDAIC